MEKLEKVDPIPSSSSAPLFSGSSDPDPPRRTLWSRLQRTVNEKLVPTRALTVLTDFQNLIQSLTAIAKTESPSMTLAKTLDQSGYIAVLRETGTDEAENRLGNLQELVSAARDYELRESDATLSSFVDRLSLLSDTDEEQGSRDAQVWLLSLIHI